jgi:PKHD-type hydroxylase
MIIQIPDVLSAAEVGRCRELLEGANWTDGRATAGHTAARAKQNEQLAPDDPLAEQLASFLLGRLGETSQFIASALPLKILPPRFNRYTGHGTYGDHIDNAIFAVPGTPVRLRGDLSATLFLSDPDEYDGGELIIRDQAENRRLKLPAGHMVVYPARTVHQVAPVTRGARLASFFWIQSLVREDHRRAMLMDLDRSVQRIAGERPDDPSIVELTGLYHNLLREWSDT